VLTNSDPEYSNAPELAAYMKALKGLNTALTEADFERLGKSLSAYCATAPTLARVEDRMHALRAALAHSMDLLN
jgi:hypothetical protein